MRLIVASSGGIDGFRLPLKRNAPVLLLLLPLRTAEERLVNCVSVQISYAFSLLCFAGTGWGRALCAATALRLITAVYANIGASSFPLMASFDFTALSEMIITSLLSVTASCSTITKLRCCHFSLGILFFCSSFRKKNIRKKNQVIESCDVFRGCFVRRVNSGFICSFDYSLVGLFPWWFEALLGLFGDDLKSNFTHRPLPSTSSSVPARNFCLPAILSRVELVPRFHSTSQNMVSAS